MRSHSHNAWLSSASICRWQDSVGHNNAICRWQDSVSHKCAICRWQDSVSHSSDICRWQEHSCIRALVRAIALLLHSALERENLWKRCHRVSTHGKRGQPPGAPRSSSVMQRSFKRPCGTCQAPHPVPHGRHGAPGMPLERGATAAQGSLRGKVNGHNNTNES
jgi:hypothetical protein